MSLLGADLVTVTSIETKTTANSSQLMQARYGAEAGVQRTINWLSNNLHRPSGCTTERRQDPALERRHLQHQHSLGVSGGGTNIIDSGPVLIYPAGQGVTRSVDLSGGTLSNITGIPGNFQILTNSAADMVLSGGAGYCGVVYTPCQISRSAAAATYTVP